MKFSPYAAVVVACFAIALSGSKPAMAEAGFVTFEDPLEHAFSLDVPSRWTTRGGMFRLGYSDFRPMLDLKSPDGKISIRSGDVAIPRDYALPTAFHPREGEADDLGAQAQLIYANYRTGKEYAELYALARFKAVCRSLAPQANSWTPPGAREAQTSAGSVTYRCETKAGGTRTAYVYALTERVPDGNSLWQVASLVSFIAPAERIASIHAIIVRGTNTFNLNPAWITRQKALEDEGLRYQRARQAGRIAVINRQAADFATRMRGMQAQVNSFERGQAARRGQFAGFDNALNGITPTVDPLNGETRDVWTGPKNGYWQNGSGTIVNSNASPGTGFHELQPH